MTDFPDKTVLPGKKIAGYTVDVFLNADEDSHWYEVHSDDGNKAILYVYRTLEERNAACCHIRGFRTSLDEVIQGIQSLHVFANIGDHRLMMPLNLRDFLIEEETRPSSIAGYAIERVLGFGFKGVTFKAIRTKGTSTPYALKVTIAEEYDGKTFLPEVDHMVEVASRDRDHFPQIHECGCYNFEVDNSTFSLVYFVEDFISGMTLEKVLESSPESLDVTFLYDYIKEMLAAVATLQACQLMHDDLHAGNVMLHEPPSGRRRPYLIDFGSAKPLGTTKKSRDDIRNLASQIAEIANAIQDHGAARTAHEERILTACESLLAAISDDDPMRRPENAMELLGKFERCFVQGAIRQELRHPFDFGNAEEVMDNSLLYSLAAKSFPWRDKIEASSHLLVVGPRGCGKTTVFRSMSFRCLADAEQIDDALARPYIGLYISCNKEFRQRFSAIDRDVLLARQDDIRHYFNLIVLRELSSVLVALSKAGRLFDSDMIAITRFMQEHCPELLASKPLSDASDLEARVTRAVHGTRMAIWNGTPLTDRTTQGFVADLTEFTASHLSLFSGKMLYLFVDDYTEGKVPKEAQQALNHILFVPNSGYKCKISSEVFGVTPDETYGNFLVQDREYREWNLGTLYCLTLPSKMQKEFLKEIVDNRLKLCDYKGRVDSVIGESSYSEGTLERTLKRESDLRKKGRQSSEAKPTAIIEKEVERKIKNASAITYYHGWDTICNLCTGDVSNILELLNRMFEECAVKKNTAKLVPPDHQNAVIEGYAKQYISKIKGIPGFGEQMFSIVDAFGNMARRLLEDYPLVKHGKGRDEPYRLLRIELDEAFRNGAGMAGEESDLGKSLKLWKLLQRYGIFIDADEGRSRRNTLSSRVILRRIFCPAFRIGLVNSECWTLSKLQWKAFCSDPAGRAEQYAKECIEKALQKRGKPPLNEDQGLLPFTDTDED